MKLFIEPNDVLMFRDGRPFAGGDDHFARGIFPPSPSTIYGALRSHILSVRSGEFDTFKTDTSKISQDIIKEVGSPNETGSLKITYFTLARNDDGYIRHYFPIAKDISKTKGRDDKKSYILKPESFLGNIFMTNMPSGLQHIWSKTDEAIETVSGFLSEEEMTAYLFGKVPEKIIEAKEIYETEERTGIRKNKTSRSVEKGGLYSVEYFRMKGGFGFALEVEGSERLPDKGIMRLGGDNRSTYFYKSTWKDIDTKTIKEEISRSRRFKLVLITPAILQYGWLMKSIDNNTLEGAINGVRVKMISACIGKPIGIGGFDIVNGIPKTMKKAVPAGSVYYFELADGNVDNLFDMLWLKSISDERAQEGFGITLIGGY